MFNYKLERNKILIFPVLLVFLLICVLFYHYFSNTKELVISEVCSHNKSIIFDYYGEYSDYIEIYNNSNNSIDLSSYYLSDNEQNLFKMPLPNYVLAPHEYYVVFLDSHISTFSLSDNETVLLSNDNGKIYSCISLPEMKDNESYCINDDGEYYIGVPSPNGNMINSISDNNKSIILDDVVIASKESGFYDESFYLTLSTSEDVTIYYTLDSTQPNENSLKYDSPIYIYDKSNENNVYSNVKDISTVNDNIPEFNVKKCMIVRAVGIDKNGNKTEELTNSYFINYDNKKGYNDLPTLSIVSNPDNLFDYENGIYVKGKLYDDYDDYSELKVSGEKILNIDDFNMDLHPANYRIDNHNYSRDAKVDYFVNKELKSEDNIKISIHGGHTRSYNQKSFNLIKYDDNISYLFNTFGKSNELCLRNGGNDAFGTKIKDVINQQIVSDRNILIQEYEPVQVFLDGEYWGVYMLQEKVDKRLVNKKYGVSEDNIVIIKNENNVLGDDNKYLSEYLEIKNMISNLNMAIDDNYKYVQEIIDIQSYIDFKCFELYVYRTDGTMKANPNNVAIWKAKTVNNNDYCDGKYRWILFDTESSGIFSKKGTVTGDLFINGLNDKMFNSLLKNDDFQNKFINTYLDMINYNFNFNNIHKMIKQIVGRIDYSMVESLKRFYSNDFTINDYYSNVNDYINFYRNRREYALQNLINDFKIKEDLCSISIINKENINYHINSIETNRSFEGFYFKNRIITLSTEDINIYGWKVNNIEYNNRNIDVLVDGNMEILPLYKK